MGDIRKEDALSERETPPTPDKLIEVEICLFKRGYAKLSAQTK